MSLFIAILSIATVIIFSITWAHIVPVLFPTAGFGIHLLLTVGGGFILGGVIGHVTVKMMGFRRHYRVWPRD